MEAVVKIHADKPAVQDRSPRGARPAPKPEAVEEAIEPQRAIADHLVHAAIARAWGGISPISLAQAWQDWLLHLSVSPGRQTEIMDKARDKWQRLFRLMLNHALTGEHGEKCIEPLPADRRFDDPAWCKYPFNLIHQSFLLTQQWWHNATTQVPGVTRQHERMVEFYSRQLLDVFSPSNFPATNPEVIGRTLATGGRNLLRGADNFMHDARRFYAGEKPPALMDFVVGKDVAATPGKVVYRNELIELIQYEPACDKVRPEPVLITPAWIMKYYILDLSPQNSLIRFLLSQGFTVFAISWINPGKELRETSFDDYRRLGPEAAVDAIRDITGAGKVHAVGYCLGGTLLSIEAARLAREQDDRLATVTLLAAQVDFTEAGELTLFTDESQISFLEDLMWQKGYLDSSRMAGAFQMLRSQDLVWSRMVRDYMMGDRAPMNDLMAWNLDATRMPYRMHSQYLRKLFLDNDLAEGRFAVGERPVFLEDIRQPVFTVATETDHVSPWHSVFKLLYLLDTDVTFVLTSGGHNAGIVSEPGHPHRHYRISNHPMGSPNSDPESWLAAHDTREGSWWPQWTAWLEAHSGAPVAPPRTGAAGKGYPVLEDAPGSYVLMQ